MNLWHLQLSRFFGPKIGKRIFFIEQTTHFLMNEAKVFETKQNFRVLKVE